MTVLMPACNHGNVLKMMDGREGKRKEGEEKETEE